MGADTRYVLDANVFIHAGVDTVSQVFDRPMTVPLVVDELQSRDAGRRFDRSTVDVYAPGDDAVSAVRAAAAEQGEELSDADIAVVALAYDRDAVLVSDDYGVQNIAEHLNIPYTGFEQEEIDTEITWTRVCPACDEETDDDRCPVCGTETQRVPESD